MQTEQAQESYEGFAIIELMGRHVIAGHVSTQIIGGAAMLRVDVPETDDQPGYTKFFSGSALYAITPTDEATAKLAAQKFRVRPVDEWTLPTPRALPAPMTQGGEYDTDGYYDDDEDEPAF